LKEKKTKWIIILLVVVLIAVAVDITIRLSTPAKPDTSLRYSKMLVKIGMEDPDCANKFLKAGNMTNIHIVPPGTLETRRKNLSHLN
jgi:flagellar basal body-associated protein FliL